MTEVDGRSHNHTECYGSSRERTNVDGSLQKVLRSHGKLKEGSSAARKVDIGLQKVLWTHETLTEYPADALKVDGWYCRRTES